MDETKNETKTYFCRECDKAIGFPSDLCTQCEDELYPQDNYYCDECEYGEDFCYDVINEFYEMENY